MNFRWFPLQPEAPACTTMLCPWLLATNLVFIFSANFICSLGLFFAIHKSGAAALWWLQDYSPTICSLHFSSSHFLSAFTSPPMLLLLFASISWFWFCFLKVACLAQVTGHDGRCLGLRGGAMKEDHTENMPCMSLLCLDQMCTMWLNTTVIRH